MSISIAPRSLSVHTNTPLPDAPIEARRSGHIHGHGKLTRMALLLAIGTPLALGGCGKADDDGADEFRAGVPAHEDVTMTIPGMAAGQQGALSAGAGGGVSATDRALLGEQAELYRTTRGITAVVNGATVAVLTLVKTITEFPPSTVGPNVAVWGPHTDPLQANTWRLTVNRVDVGVFQYALDAKPRGTADTMFLTILSGQHTVANPGMRRRANLPAYGSGQFVLDWDNAQKLPDHDENVGKATFTYSRPTPIAAVTIAATFSRVLDKETGMLIDARYSFAQTPGQGGNFQFNLTKDAILTTVALETMTVRSRWQETGAGRSDVKLTGGDLAAAEATTSECWSAGDFGFTSVYVTNSYGDPAKLWGAESDCAFAPAQYAMF